MSDKVKFEILNTLLDRVQAAARAPQKGYVVTIPPKNYEAEDRELAESRTRRDEEEALMLTYIAKLEFVARRCRSLGLDHTSDLDDWLEKHPKLHFVSLPAR